MLELVSQSMLAGSRDILAQSMAGATSGKEEDAYARYLASFQQQLDPAGPKTAMSELERAKAMTMLGEMDRARLAMSLSQAQSLPRGVPSGYYTHAAQGSGDQGDRPGPAYQGGR